MIVGQTIVQKVVTKLSGAGIDAIRAYPAEKLTGLSGVRAAVSLQSTDPEKGTATVLIHVCSPLSAGGSACEDAASRVCVLLRGMGGQCKQGQCAQLDRKDILCVEVSAVFLGWDAGGGWTGFAVTLGGVALPYVRAVKVWRSIGDADSLGEAVWKFRIEETLPPESSEGAAVTEPFTLTVTRGSRSEAYSQCTLTYHRCELDAGALRRIRQGVAGSRSVNG